MLMKHGALLLIDNVSMLLSERDDKSCYVPLVSIGYMVPFSSDFNRAFFLPQIKISSLEHTAQTLYNDGYTMYSTTFRSSPLISPGVHFGYNIISHSDLEVPIAPGTGFNFLMKFEQIDNYKFSSTNSSTVVTEMDHLKPLIDLQATIIIKKRFVIWSAYNFPQPIPTTRLRKTGLRLNKWEWGINLGS